MSPDRGHSIARADLSDRAIARFWGYVQKAESCWMWRGIRSGCGYGTIRIRNRTRLAHRVSYVLHFGGLAQHVCVLHRCDVQLCVRPAHLFLGTQLDNRRDASAKGRTAKGERVAQSRLRESDVREMRRLFAQGAPVRYIASRFEIDPSHAYRIRSGLYWNHIA